MPFKAPTVDRCPKCNKPAYDYESKRAAGQKWHKACFKCGECNKALESTTVAEHDGWLYCKQCHGKKFGPKGFGFGGGSAGLSTETSSGHSACRVGEGTITGARVEGGCPRCGRRVYAAERKVGCGMDWHKTCFNCNNCHKTLDSTTLTESEGEIYCKGCYGRLFGPKGVGFGGGAGCLSTETVGGPRSTGPAVTVISGPAVEGGCPRCGKRVYAAEKKVGCGREWHKTCFNCAACHKSIDSTTLTEKDGEIYCKACYGSHFGPKGVGFGGGSGALSTY